MIFCFVMGGLFPTFRRTTVPPFLGTSRIGLFAPTDKRQLDPECHTLVTLLHVPLKPLHIINRFWPSNWHGNLKRSEQLNPKSTTTRVRRTTRTMPYAVIRKFLKFFFKLLICHVNSYWRWRDYISNLTNVMKPNVAEENMTALKATFLTACSFL